MASDDKPVLSFETQRAWELWLKTNHKSSGVWVRFAKKASGLKSVTYAEAIEIALCYGWIDGQAKKDTEDTYLQKFTPRTKRSIWSKINRQKALALIENGRMKPPGLYEVERAKQDGRWDAAYDSWSRATVPDDLQVALGRNADAQACFDTLDCRNRYAILFRLQTTKKAETRVKKIQQFVEMLARNEKLY